MGKEGARRRHRLTAPGQTFGDGGDELSVPVFLTQWVHTEERAGRWDRAATLMEDGRAAGRGLASFKN